MDRAIEVLRPVGRVAFYKFDDGSGQPRSGWRRIESLPRLFPRFADG
jgi:hypothetical protein